MIGMQSELEEAARSLVAESIVEPAPFTAVEARAKAIRSRGRRLRNAGIGSASLILIAVVALIVHSGGTAQHTVVVRGAGSSNVVPVQCCEGENGFALNGIVPTVRPHCVADVKNVTLALTQSRLSFTFSCSEVLHNPRRVEVAAVSKVATRRNAARRAAKIVAYEKQLGVYGDVVKGHREYPDDVRSDTFTIGVAGSDYLCAQAGNLQFRANEIRDAAHGGESAVHWLKIEAARIAGLCPEKLATLYDTVQRAGATEAVASVRPLLASAGGMFACPTEPFVEPTGALGPTTTVPNVLNGGDPWAPIQEVAANYARRHYGWKIPEIGPVYAVASQPVEIQGVTLHGAALAQNVTLCGEQAVRSSFIADIWAPHAPGPVRSAAELVVGLFPSGWKVWGEYPQSS
ncbi:MAG TPA: hypothetical protein VGO03_19775 [Acidimicrobiia bacterium]